MKATAVGLVTPHVLRVVDLATQAEKGVNVEWSIRGAVNGTLSDLQEHYNAAELTAAYIEGLDSLVAQAGNRRLDYLRALQAAVAAARNPR